VFHTELISVWLTLCMPVRNDCFGLLSLFPKRGGRSAPNQPKRLLGNRV